MTSPVRTQIDFTPYADVSLPETLEQMRALAGAPVSLVLLKLRHTELSRPLAQLTGDEAAVRAFLECHGYDVDAYL